MATVRAALALGLVSVVAGCGSAPVSELPPAAQADRSPTLVVAPAGQRSDGSNVALATPVTTFVLRGGSLLAVLLPRERVLKIVDVATGREVSRASAGVGPTNLACGPEGPCFVTDTHGDALLVMRVGDGGRSLRISRRVYVAGAPYAIAIDPQRRRLWVTLTARNELVELGAHGRPHILQRLPTIRQPDAVTVSRATGMLTIMSPEGEVQRIPDPTSGDG